MFIGHYAPAYALKARYREVPLWALALGVQAVDVAFFVLAPLGIERLNIIEGARGPLGRELVHMPFTHSLAAAVLYTLACIALGRLAGRPRVGLALGLAVGSHWVCDFVVHTPDLPLAWAGTPKLGLGLWRYPGLSCALELGVLFAGAAWLYGTLPVGAARRWLVGGAAFLALVQVVNDFLLPPPASVIALAVSAEVSFVLLAALMWPIDRAAVPPSS